MPLTWVQENPKVDQLLSLRIAVWRIRAQCYYLVVKNLKFCHFPGTRLNHSWSFLTTSSYISNCQAASQQHKQMSHKYPQLIRFKTNTLPLTYKGASPPTPAITHPHKHLLTTEAENSFQRWLKQYPPSCNVTLLLPHRAVASDFPSLESGLASVTLL